MARLGGSDVGRRGRAGRSHRGNRSGPVVNRPDDSLRAWLPTCAPRPRRDLLWTALEPCTHAGEAAHSHASPRLAIAGGSGRRRVAGQYDLRRTYEGDVLWSRGGTAYEGCFRGLSSSHATHPATAADGPGRPTMGQRSEAARSGHVDVDHCASAGGPRMARVLRCRRRCAFTATGSLPEVRGRG